MMANYLEVISGDFSFTELFFTCVLWTLASQNLIREPNVQNSIEESSAMKILSPVAYE